MCPSLFCAGLRGFAQVRAGSRGFARVRAGLRGFARVRAGLFGFAWVCARGHLRLSQGQVQISWHAQGSAGLRGFALACVGFMASAALSRGRRSTFRRSGTDVMVSTAFSQAQHVHVRVFFGRGLCTSKTWARPCFTQSLCFTGSSLLLKLPSFRARVSCPNLSFTPS